MIVCWRTPHACLPSRRARCWWWLCLWAVFLHDVLGEQRKAISLARAAFEAGLAGAEDLTDEETDATARVLQVRILRHPCKVASSTTSRSRMRALATPLSR